MFGLSEMSKGLRQIIALAMWAGLLLLCAASISVRAQGEPQSAAVEPAVAPQSPAPPSRKEPAKMRPARAPQARPAAVINSVGAPQAPASSRPAPAPQAQRPAHAPKAPAPPRQLVTVVHRLSGWKLLTWLAVSGPPALELDRFPSASDVHTNIVAGFVSNDGRSVMARLPQAEVEFGAHAMPQLPPGFLSEQNGRTPAITEFTLVNREGKRVEANFVGFDAATGLSLLEANEPLLPLNGDTLSAEAPAVGQRVHLFAPTPAAQPVALANDSGVTDEHETIYLDMGRTEGQLVEVRRATSGKAARVTARAPRVSPAWSGALATSQTGSPLGIVALSGGGETQIVPVEDVRAAIARVRATRAGIVPQPWLGVRGDTAFNAPLTTWIKNGWKRETALPLIQSRKGVLLTSVAPDSPAFQAGLKPGDVIVSVGAREIVNIEDLTMLLKEAGVGAKISFTVRRASTPSPQECSVLLGGVSNPALATLEAEMRAARSKIFDMRSGIAAARQEEERLRAEGRAAERYAVELAALETRRQQAESRLTEAQMQLAEAEARIAQTRARLLRPNDWPMPALSGFWEPRPLRASGLEVVGLTARGAMQLGARGGVLVVSVLPGSAAEQSGIRAGDVIETAAGRAFSHADLHSILKNATRSRIDLGLVRGPQKLTVLLSLDRGDQE